MGSRGSAGSGGPVQDDGFGTFRDVFDRLDIDAMGALLQTESIVRSRAGARHLMRYAAVRQLAGHPRLLSLARRFIGAEAALSHVLLQRGGVVAMRPLVVHTSSKADSDRPRRVLHIEYAGDVFMDGGLELALV